MESIYDLVDEVKSPLFRIMSVYNYSNPSTARYDNNISCFHVGKGVFLSVAHNLKTKTIPREIEELNFQNNILAKTQMDTKKMFNKYYILNSVTGKRQISNIPENETQTKIINELLKGFQMIQYDTSFEEDYNKSVARPFLIIQFRKNSFYSDNSATKKIDIKNIFHEPRLNRYTFVFELQIVKAFYDSDISVYKIINSDQSVIDLIPSIELDFNLYDTLSDIDLFCLQSSASSELGRMLNTAKIDGIADHWANFSDNVHQNNILEGKRYISRNYFRFGSSGAPYILFDKATGVAKANAIQSEACPIQLTIHNDRNGNFQYTHALATPLNNVELELRKLI